MSDAPVTRHHFSPQSRSTCQPRGFEHTCKIINLSTLEWNIMKTGMTTYPRTKRTMLFATVLLPMSMSISKKFGDAWYATWRRTRMSTFFISWSKVIRIYFQCPANYQGFSSDGTLNHPWPLRWVIPWNNRTLMQQRQHYQSYVWNQFEAAISKLICSMDKASKKRCLQKFAIFSHRVHFGKSEVTLSMGLCRT